MEEIHICTNCKHHCYESPIVKIDVCDAHPISGGEVDYVTGEIFLKMFERCRQVRYTLNNEKRRCPDYEPKSTLWQKIKKLFKR